MSVVRIASVVMSVASFAVGRKNVSGVVESRKDDSGDCRDGGCDSGGG